MLLALVTPPPVKPSEPGLSAHAAAMVLRGLGVDAVAVDASIGWHRFVLDPERLAGARVRATSSGSTGRRAAPDPRAPFKNHRAYTDRRVYTSAVNELERSLKVVGHPYPALRLGIASVSLSGGARLESSATLAELSSTAGPFDAYYEQELIPLLRSFGATHVGVSLTFQFQAPAAFRLAALLARDAPDIRRVLGGPLVDCWLAAGFALEGAPFERFHEVSPGGRDDMERLAEKLRRSERPTLAMTSKGPLAVPFEEAPWEDYLSPAPVVPAALGRGCYWRRCTFCPDHVHPPHDPCRRPELESWLLTVAARFPTGAMLHLTDSALPPGHLRHIAEVVRRERLPIQWHGFVRPERRFTDRGLMRELAEGGCAMLQVGVETASPRLIELLGKGTTADTVDRVLGAAAEEGISVQAYLLFGLPTETDDDREMTLAMIERHAAGVLAVNSALLNLPKGSPMHRRPDDFDITEVVPFHRSTDLSLYDDFRCGPSHPRVEARRWLDRRFFKSTAVRAIAGGLRTPFKANHLCFLGARGRQPPAASR